MLNRFPLLLAALVLVAAPALALAGSDTSGAYDYIDSNEIAEPLRPDYSFDSIANTGTAKTPADDGWQTWNFGFPFTYYGSSYTSLRMQGNGFVTFDSDAGTFGANDQLPTDRLPDNTIVGWWDDLTPGGGKGYVQILGASPYRTAVIEYNNYEHFGDAAEKVTFQIRLYETFNTIDVIYLAANFDNWEAAAGIQGNPGALHGVDYHWADVDKMTTTVQYRDVNAAPVGQDDAYSIDEDGTLVANVASGVLANDNGIGYAPVEALLVSSPTEGGLTFAPDGSFTYTPNADFSGSDSFSYKLDDAWAPAGGYTKVHTVNITVIERNDMPTYSAGSAIAVDEDVGLYTVGWATSMSDGSVNETQTLRWDVTNDNPGLFTVQPTLLPDGRLRFQPAPDAHGKADVTVVLYDDGAHNGTTEHNRTADRTFTLTVRPIDDAPQAVADSASVLEDGSVSVDVLANDDIAPDQAETLSIDAVTGAAHGTVSIVSGKVVYTPAADYFGSETLTVTIKDSNGTTATSTLGITVVSVNDAPTFVSPQAAISLVEDAGAQSIAWATSASPGPANEASQTLSVVTTNDNNALFDAQPQVDNTGVLTFTAKPDAFGIANVVVELTDTGANVAPDDANTTYMFTLEVRPVNDAPTGILGGPISISSEFGPASYTGFLTGAGFGPANEAQTLNAPVVTVGDPSLFATQPAISGDTLTFEPMPAMAGATTLTVVLKDNGGTSDGGVDTTALTQTITVLNMPPVAVDDIFEAPEGASAIPLDVLSNDSDPNGHAMTIVPGSLTTPLSGGVATGTVSIANNKVMIDTPVGFTGPITFQYKVQDTYADFDTGNVTVNVADPTTPLLRIHGPTLVCVGNAAAFTIESHYASSSPTSGAVSYGDGNGVALAGSDIASASHTYAAKAVVTVTASTTFADGEVGSVTHGLTVNNCIAPKAEFRTSAAGLTLTFDDESTDSDGTIVGRSWNMGDGTTYSGTSVTHAFPAYGTYLIALTVTDEEGNTHAISRAVTLAAPKESGAVGKPVNNAAPAPTEPPAPPASDAPPSTPAPTGTGNAAPVARVTAPDAAVVGESFAVSGGQSSDADGDVLTFHWAHVSGPFIGLDTTAITQQLVGFTAGTSVFELTVSDGDVSTSKRVSIEIREPELPTPDFNLAADATEVAFADLTNAGPDATYAWDFGDGTTSTERAPKHTYAAPGEYVVRLVVRDGGTSRETAQVVSVSEAAPAPPVGEAAAVNNAPVVEAASLNVGLIAGIGALVVGATVGTVLFVRKR